MTGTEPPGASSSLQIETEDDISNPTTRKIIVKFNRNVRLHDQKYACKLCDTKYTTKHYLDRHILVHGTYRVYQFINTLYRFGSFKVDRNIHFVQAPTENSSTNASSVQHTLPAPKKEVRIQMRITSTD